MTALSQPTAKTERMFGMMSRIKGKLSSRMFKSLGHRMRVKANALCNTELICEVKKGGYNIKMNGSTSWRQEPGPLGWIFTF